VDKMTDLSLLYYSCHSLPKHQEIFIRDELAKLAGDSYPIISVTQKPVKFGENICVGEIGQSHYNYFKQILIGAKAAKTKYIACCEDDTLYSLEHFSHRPSSDKIFAYNESAWFLEHSKTNRSFFWHKYQRGEGYALIAPTALLIEVIDERFEKYPIEPPRNSQKHYWQEPGRDDRLGLKKQPVEYFKTEIPLITLNYFAGLNGKKTSMSNPRVVETKLKHWGKADDLTRKIFGKGRESHY
jgi:hypothetical protein